MNREQMIAWLTLEGWDYLAAPCDNDSDQWHMGFLKGARYVYTYTYGGGPHLFEYASPAWIEHVRANAARVGVGEGKHDIHDAMIRNMFEMIEEKSL